MAKNGVKNKDKCAKKGGSFLFYISAFLIALVLLTTMLGTIFYFIVKNNVNGITERHRSILSVIPVIKNAVGEESEYGDGIDYLSHYELKQVYRELFEEHSELKALYDQATEDIENLQETNRAYLDKFREYGEREKKIEDDRKKLEEDIRRFEVSVAEHDSNAFIDYFEQMNEQTAREVYEILLMERQEDSKNEEIAGILMGMEPQAAASIVSELGGNNIDTVTDVISNMKKNAAALVLEQVEPDLASEIILRLSE